MRFAFDIILMHFFRQKVKVIKAYTHFGYKICIIWLCKSYIILWRMNYSYFMLGTHYVIKKWRITILHKLDTKNVYPND